MTSALQANSAASDQVQLSVKKRKANRELFPLNSKKDLVIRKLAISEIGFTREHFAIEGKVLNLYGTYDFVSKYPAAKVPKYLKVDLTDSVGFSTVTLIFGESYYKNYLDKLSVDLCIRVEGVNVSARNPNDGGSIDFSLSVDATTLITPIPFFKSDLFFVPELTIRSFLAKASLNPNLKSTITFVIVQVDNVQKSEGGVFEQLTIVDGPAPSDCATLTFVNKRKGLYHQMVDEFYRGNSGSISARNIGVWKDRSNTLSILDMTLIAPVHSEKHKKKLQLAYSTQIKSLGFGKEVVGQLRILNFNGTLLVRKCSNCKGQNINLLTEGGYCFSCGKDVVVHEVVKLLAKILLHDSSTEVSISGEIVDKVLQFKKPLLQMIKEEQGLTRLLLSEVEISGVFMVDSHG